MATLLLSLSNGEVIRSTDPHENFATETNDEVLTLVGHTLVEAQESGLSFMLFPDDKTGTNRLVNLFSIVSVDVVRESAAVTAVRESADMRPTQDVYTRDEAPGGVL